jgi:hypothetical protein
LKWISIDTRCAGHRAGTKLATNKRRVVHEVVRANAFLECTDLRRNTNDDIGRRVYGRI